MKLTRTVRLNPYLIFLVPLADLTFVLVLLFLSSTTFLLRSGISVRLPHSRFVLGPEQNPLILTVTASPYPTIYCRDGKFTLAELPKGLAGEQRENAEVVIRADRDTPHGLVVQVMDLCLERGFNVVLATTPKEE